MGQERIQVQDQLLAEEQEYIPHLQNVISCLYFWSASL